MPRRIITLTTDFGTSDHFAGTMRGVILSIQPAAEIVDITHEIRPFDISDGGFTIAQAYRFFPKKTIHVVVVDPGVGSTRRPLLAEMAGQFFIAPDNGVLSMIFTREAHADHIVKARHITNERYFLKPLSRTFHGRDVFAPAAAHLAAGIAPARFGPLIRDYLRLDFDKPSHNADRSWTGCVLKVDRFGNLITNLHIDQFPQLKTRAFELTVGLQTIKRLALTFTDCEPDELCALVGSSGYLEVATNQGSAAQLLGCGAGAPVELTIY
ncbi:MAG TPA: SAM-dependent chlorinase/fluorinase [Bryobacteraceae bacterium]|nr:SAM-dependent chlorinase/fluorinase [Bryobacteraceae bacterium]